MGGRKNGCTKLTTTRKSKIEDGRLRLSDFKTKLSHSHKLSKIIMWFWKKKKEERLLATVM